MTATEREQMIAAAVERIAADEATIEQRIRQAIEWGYVLASHEVAERDAKAA